METNQRSRGVAAAAALYLALTIAFTWPLARGIAHDVPGDFGDPVLNSWILAWDVTHFGRGWWNANIFYPHPLSLAYSEHLAGPAAQIAPIYWLTGNPILCYNLLFLSTFVLSGVGVYLLVEEWAGNRSAAFVAGMAYAFAPYRIASIPHVQVLSSAWMPFVLFALRRYFATRRAAALGGAAAAWVMQNLSCGYYALFFAPVVVIYIAWELTTGRLWSNARVLAALAILAAVVAAGTVPFLLPYLELRRLGFNPRSIAETRKFSADVYAYATADPNLRLWGSAVRAWPNAEGALFPGAMVVVLAVVAALRSAKAVALQRSQTMERDGFSRALIALMAVSAAATLLLLFGISIRLPVLRITSFSRALIITTLIWSTAIAASPAIRQALACFLRTPAGLFTIITAFAIVMSFGPEIRAQGRLVLDTNLYAVFYASAPGFDGLRVPARYAMIVALGLSVLAGLALRRTLPAAAVALLAFVVFTEGFAAPIPINQNSTGYERAGLADLPPLEPDAPPVYAFLATLPPSSAIVELPLGEPAFDVRYMFHSRRHWKPLVNGYSGGRPAEYEVLDHALQDALIRPERAWELLTATRATHAVVHEAFYRDDRGPRISDWLRREGARELTSVGSDRVFVLP